MPTPRLLSTLLTLPAPATSVALLPRPLRVSHKCEKVCMIGAAITAAGTVEIFDVTAGTVSGQWLHTVSVIGAQMRLFLNEKGLVYMKNLLYFASSSSSFPSGQPSGPVPLLLPVGPPRPNQRGEVDSSASETPAASATASASFIRTG